MDEIIILVCLIIIAIFGYLIKYKGKIELVAAIYDDLLIDRTKLTKYAGSKILLIAESRLLALLASILFPNVKLYLIISWSIVSFILVLKIIVEVQKLSTINK
jgi:hypothetical protein